MLRKIRSFYLNTEFVESVFPVDELNYELHMASGEKHLVSREMGDKIILEMKARDAKKAAAEKALPQKTKKDLKEVLEMARKVNSPFGR